MFIPILVPRSESSEPECTDIPMMYCYVIVMCNGQKAMCNRWCVSVDDNKDFVRIHYTHTIPIYIISQHSPVETKADASSPNPYTAAHNPTHPKSTSQNHKTSNRTYTSVSSVDPSSHSPRASP